MRREMSVEQKCTDPLDEETLLADITPLALLPNRLVRSRKDGKGASIGVKHHDGRALVGHMRPLKGLLAWDTLQAGIRNLPNRFSIHKRKIRMEKELCFLTPLDTWACSPANASTPSLSGDKIGTDEDVVVVLLTPSLQWAL